MRFRLCQVCERWFRSRWRNPFDPNKRRVNNVFVGSAFGRSELCEGTLGMNTFRPAVIGRLSTVVIVLLALISPAVAQKPTEAQIDAIRQACRADYQSYCSSVPTGGSAALECLRQNRASLSAPCREAVGALGGPAGAAQSPKPATAPTAAMPAPAAPSSLPPRPMSPRQEAMLLRRSCGMDYRTYCSNVPPGGGRIIECLRENGPSLSRQCRSALMSATQGR
jgi:Cysteine rich repeat